MERPSAKSLYSQMYRDEKILIIDHNTLYYHSFDLLRYMLSHEENFIKLTHDHDKFVELKSSEMIQYARDRIDTFEITSLFDSDCHIDIKRYLNKLSEFFSSAKSCITKTDLFYNIGSVFVRPNISGIILRMEGDDSPLPELSDNVKIYKSKNIFNIATLVEFIKANNITAVILDSIDMALTLSAYLTKTSFMIASYKYNYDDVLGMPTLKGTDLLCLFEYGNFNEYGVFEPFRSIPKYGMNNSVKL